MGASQSGMGTGGERTCAGRVRRRVSQGGGAPSNWNHGEETGAGATERLTNWYLQVNTAPGEARQEKAVMSKNPGRSAWAEQAQKQLREQREKEMPGMQVAKQQATQDTKDGKAEKAAQRKEALQLREAQEVRGVQESLQTLALDPLLSAKAREWSDNGALMEKLITCANQMGAKLKRAEAQGVAFMTAAALTAGKRLRAAAIRALEARTSPPYALLLEPVTNGEVQPTALAGELAREYPGTVLVPASSRKMGADGRMPEAPAPKNGKNQVVPFPQVPGRGTYVIKIERVSDALLRAVAQGDPIRVGQEEFNAHLLPVSTRGMLQIEISRDSRTRMHILMAQMAMLGLKPMQVESTLLHMIREGMGVEGQKIGDIYIDREGTAIIDKHTGRPFKVINVKAPFAEASRDVRHAYGLPTSIAANNALGAAPRIWIIFGNEQDMAPMKTQGGALCTVSTGMGTIEMSVITTNTYESELGLVAAAQRVETMSSAAVTMPKEWLQKMLALAREQGATVPAVALSSFCDENTTMFHARAIAHAHPEVQKIVREVVQEWSKLRKELNGAARGGITGNTAWVTAAEILQKALDEVGKVDQTLITIQVSIVEGAWRDMFAVPRTMQHPPIEFLKKQLHRVVAESALHLAAYTLILIPSGTDNSAALVQGLRGQNGGPVFTGKMWATAAEEARAKHATQEKPNTLFISLARPPSKVMLRATLIGDVDNATVGITAEIKAVFKQALLKELEHGGAIFVPRRMKTGAINQLTGQVSECEGKAGGIWDVRHEKFEKINLLPAEARDGAVMPIILEMVMDRLVAPVASSENEGSDTVAYMASLFATEIDQAALNNQFSWAGIQYGTDIRQEVIDNLQQSFVHRLSTQVKRGVWVHSDMVVAGYAAADDGEIAHEEIDKMKRNLDRAMATHPFRGGAVAKQVITELIRVGKIAIVGSQGAGIMVLLPEMKDVIELIQTQGRNIAPLGEEINYNEIKLSMSAWGALIDGIGRDILDHMHQASMTFLWLLGKPDQVAGPTKAWECPIKAQHSNLEKFEPLVTQALPNSIWNEEGVFLMEALDELGKRGHIGILQVPKSNLGRQGLVVVRGDKGLSFSSTYGDEAEPGDFEDILNGLYSVPLAVQGSEAPLGDNERMRNTLGMLKMRATATRLDAAVLEPKVLWGVQVTDDSKLERGQGANMEDLNGTLDLISAVKADAGIITEMVERKMRSKRFMESHGVMNCVGGILILPRKIIPIDVDDIERRALRWNPNESPIEHLWKQPVGLDADQGEDESWAVLADLEDSPRSDLAENQGTAPAELVRMECSWPSELQKRSGHAEGHPSAPEASHPPVAAQDVSEEHKRGKKNKKK
jgi:hypothetical protein